MKKTFQRLALVFPSLFLILFSFVFWAKQPSVSEKEIPTFAILHLPQNASLSSSTGDQFKVVTYNIGYASGEKNNRPVSLSREEVENNLRQMVKALRDLNADVLLLQEVDFKSARTYNINQAEFLAQELGMPYLAYAVTWNKNYLPWPYFPFRHQFGRLLSGQAVLSRYPLEDQKILHFEKPSSNPFWYNWFYLERFVQKISLKRGLQNISLYHLHLEPFDAPTREAQILKLAVELKADKNILKLVGGDFNSVSLMRLDLTVEEVKELEDSGEALKIFSSKTHLRNAEDRFLLSMPSWKPLKKIDHIFFEGPGLTLLESGSIPGLLASDHLPIWASFQLN